MLLENAGFADSMPRLIACGGRDSTFNDFETAHAAQKAGDYVAMLVDSEDVVDYIEKTWDHLAQRDQWDRPDGANDEQVLLMATCMETWIVADRSALQKHYLKLQESALPSLNNLEHRDRHDVYRGLCHATRNCSNEYTKGATSFEILSKLDPVVLKQHLPSFARVDRILKAKL